MKCVKKIVLFKPIFCSFVQNCRLTGCGSICSVLKWSVLDIFEFIQCVVCVCVCVCFSLPLFLPFFLPLSSLSLNSSLPIFFPLSPCRCVCVPRYMCLNLSCQHRCVCELLTRCGRNHFDEPSRTGKVIGKKNCKKH